MPSKVPRKAAKDCTDGKRHKGQDGRFYYAVKTGASTRWVHVSEATKPKPLPMKRVVSKTKKSSAKRRSKSPRRRPARKTKRKETCSEGIAELGCRPKPRKASSSSSRYRRRPASKSRAGKKQKTTTVKGAPPYPSSRFCGRLAWGAKRSGPYKSVILSSGKCQWRKCATKDHVHIAGDKECHYTKSALDFAKSHKLKVTFHKVPMYELEEAIMDYREEDVIPFKSSHSTMPIIWFSDPFEPKKTIWCGGFAQFSTAVKMGKTPVYNARKVAHAHDPHPRM